MCMGVMISRRSSPVEEEQQAALASIKLTLKLTHRIADHSWPTMRASKWRGTIQKRFHQGMHGLRSQRLAGFNRFYLTGDTRRYVFLFGLNGIIRAPFGLSFGQLTQQPRSVSRSKIRWRGLHLKRVPPKGLNIKADLDEIIAQFF